ncbi:hypothetical protein [Alloalcanivorax gelatiniphagus]|nr:hypothetical protein [Alloalcanivorax gelatiniphagus]
MKAGNAIGFANEEPAGPGITGFGGKSPVPIGTSKSDKKENSSIERV